MNRNTKIEIAIGIIVIFVAIVSVIIVGVGRCYIGSSIRSQNQLPIQTGPKPAQCTMEAKVCPDGSAVGRTGPNCEFAECPTTTNNSNYSSVAGSRYSGSGCFNKVDKSQGKLNAFREDFDMGEPTTTTKYENVTMGISFDIPYNPNWGNKDCHVAPYRESGNIAGELEIEFGRPQNFESSQFLLTITELGGVDNLGGDLGTKLKTMTIGSNKVSAYDNHDNVEQVSYVIIGKKHNYVFSCFDIEKIDEKSIQDLEKVVASVNLL